MNNQELYNKLEKDINLISNKIKDIQNNINSVKNNIEELKKKEKDVPEIYKIKNLINLIGAIFSNEINNKIELINNDIQKREKNIIKNIGKINDIRNNYLNLFHIEAKGKVDQSNYLKSSLIKKAELEEIKDEFKAISNDIEAINNKENNNEIEIYKINKKIEEIKISVLNRIKKNDYSDYLNNLNTKRINISNKINEEISKVEQEEQNSNNLLNKCIQTKKDKANLIENEKNSIIKEISNIQLLLNDYNDKMNMNKENILQIQNKFININEHMEKLNDLDENINKEKDILKGLEMKLLEMEKKIINEPIESYEYRNSIMKNINNCIYENNKNMNEIIKKGLINKEKKTNLLLYLNDIEKNIINNKKNLDDLIDNFLAKQNKINNRNKQDIQFINNRVNTNVKNNDFLEKLYNIEDEIDNISGKLSELIDNIGGGNNQRLENIQKELLEFQKYCDKEIKVIKSSFDGKVNDYNGECSFNSNYS